LIRLLKWLLIALLVILALGFAVYFGADTEFGHRKIAERIERLAPKSGLRIKIGKIEGSIYDKARVRDLALADPQGVFFEAPDVALDWAPFKWLDNSLAINSLNAATATLHRLPKLKPGDPNAPILPAFDIHVGAFAVEKLMIDAGVAGEARNGRVKGRADVHQRRALVDLTVDADKGDTLAVLLDAEPDKNRFDVNAELDAPSGGVFSAVIGTAQPVALRLKGDGNWRDWKGGLGMILGKDRIAQLSLSAQDGHYIGTGDLAIAGLLKGKLQRLTAPIVKVRGDATLSNRRIDAQITALSNALKVDGDGVISLSDSSFDDFLVTAKLLTPPALFPNMTGRDVALKARLDGPFARARYEYLLSAPRVAFDQTGFENVRASGKGVLSPAPVKVPVNLSASRVTGVGDVAGGILSNLNVDGILLVTDKAITGDGLILRSDKLTGKLSLFVDLRTGVYDIGLAGQLIRYAIPGLGIVDVKSELKAVPGEGGRGTRVIGRGQAWVRRFDNKFLLGLAGGLPVVDSAIERGPDGILRFTNLKLTAPLIRLVASGIRRRDGTFQLSGTGQQGKYGAFKLGLDGRIERPKLDIFLNSPNKAMGLANVRLLLDPNAGGFAWNAGGGSTMGPFVGRGNLLLPANKPAIIQFADLNISGSHGTGQLAVLDTGFDGQMSVSGSGVSGILEFAPKGAIQQIRANLVARDAVLAGPPKMIARRGEFNGVILLDPKGMWIDGTITGEGLQRGGVSLARLAANVNLRGGVGEIRASFAGSRGRTFDLQTVAQVGANKIVAIGSGTIDRKPISLSAPATLTREAGGWRLTPVALQFAGGSAKVGGLFGDTSTAMEGTIARMPLAILDMFYPDSGLSGSASGTFAWRDVVNGAPSGKADLQVRGLARAGLVLTSRPIDLGISAVMTNGRAGARMVAASGGQVLGKAQVQLSSVAGSGDIGTRLTTAPLFAQLRFSGAADTLWRLTGVETFDVQGTAAIGADITGTINRPVIRGSLRTANARVESASTGMVLTGVNASGNFDGSRLVIDRFNANAGKDGSVSGTGTVDFAAASPGIDFQLQASRAQLIARDDLAATVTGPIRIRSEGEGGVISGQVVMDRSRYRLGQSVVAAGVPRLTVREINGRMNRIATRAAPPRPWRLDMKASTPGRLMVSGLGIESEWRANLDIGGTIYAPAITGRADLLRGGYEFSGRRFELERGSIRFQGASPPDPILDILAQGDTQGLNATIRVTGTGLKPDIAFSSIPALPQDEVLSRLLFGTSITNLSAPEAVQLASAVAALRNGGNGLNPINAVRSAIGLDRLRILPADTTTGQRTSVAAGKYITRRTYVEVITDGQGYSATRAEFQVTRWLSLLSTISTIGRQSATVRISKDY
jgi:translocation and assembly module TamB